MHVIRQTIRAAADLAATDVWTGPAIKCPCATMVALNVKATNTNAPAAFSWEVSDDGVTWGTGAPPLLTLLQGDAITAQSLLQPRKAVLISNFSGGAVVGIPWYYVRPKITGHATNVIAGLEVSVFVAHPMQPKFVEAGTMSVLT